jgi:hypothetical protein
MLLVDVLKEFAGVVSFCFCVMLLLSCCRSLPQEVISYAKSRGNEWLVCFFNLHIDFHVTQET